MKDIVIIANFCRDFSETDNGRFMYLCKELSKEHKVEIITSDFGHTAKKHKDPLVHNWPFTITFLHEPGYKKNISIQRFVSHRAWGKEVKKYLEKREKPDVVYSAVPSLTAPLAAAKYCEKNGIRFIIDIQDLWPEAFQMVFKAPVVSDIVFAPFKHIANGIYKRADAICAVSQTYVNRALSVNEKAKEGHVVYLGTQLSTFDENVRNNPVKKSSEIWLGYCGSMGDSYDLNCVIDALAILKKEGIIPPKFVGMGDGEKRCEFEQYAKNLGIDCLFTGKLPYEEMCGWLKACDVVVNPVVGSSTSSIIDKHGDYVVSGLPVLNTQESVEYRALVDEYQMGFNCKNGDAEDLAGKLKVMLMDENLRIEMGKNARRCAEEEYDRKYTYNYLTSEIEGRVQWPLIKPENEIWLGYCGTLGASYDLTVVFDALRLLRRDVRFIVMGSGEREKEFKKKAEGLNVLFTGRLPYPQMCGVLAACDIAVNPIMPDAAQSIINKHADYVAAGLPVINTQECQEYRDLVEDYNMGFNCKNSDAEEMAEKLIILLDNDELRGEMGKNARRCAVKRFDRGNSYKDLINEIHSFENDKRFG